MLNFRNLFRQGEISFDWCYTISYYMFRMETFSQALAEGLLTHEGQHILLANIGLNSTQLAESTDWI